MTRTREENAADLATEWSGSQCPYDPDNFWVDDETGERVDAKTNERISGAEAARRIVTQPQLLAALRELRIQLREHVRFDVKKHYSLMVADAAADGAIAKAEGRS